MAHEDEQKPLADAGPVERPVRPLADISPDGREVWAWADRLSERVHLTDELQRAKLQLHNTLNTCGSCARWMTRDCPREKHDNRTGRSTGPSCAAIKCSAFVMIPLNAKTAALAETKIAELRQRLQAA
jgi:hypothetical protein